MAERRMFAKTIVDSDMFLDLPQTTQNLYFHLGIRADDDGFINNPKKIIRMIGSSQKDLELLINESFIIPFESGICVIKHWKIHNYIQKDRYKKTVYIEEFNRLKMANNIYEIDNVYASDTQCIQDVSETDTQVRLGKDRLELGKDRLELEEKTKPKRKRFQKPTQQEIKDYTDEIASSVDPEKFYDYYESNGWKVGKNSMKDWKATVRNWEKNNKERKQQHQPRKNLNFDDLELDEYGNLKGVF